MAAYHEFIIRGDDVAVRSYLRGYFAGRGVASGFYFGHDSPFHLPHLREAIKFHGEVVHLICEEALRATVESAVETAAEFEVKEARKIAAVSFEFDFHTANRDAAASIRDALERLPGGVELVDYAPKEIVDPHAAGMEVYTPTHEYEFKGKGRVRGDVAGVLAMHQRLCDIEHFNVEKIEIHRRAR